MKQEKTERQCKVSSGVQDLLTNPENIQTNYSVIIFDLKISIAIHADLLLDSFSNSNQAVTLQQEKNKSSYNRPFLS